MDDESETVDCDTYQISILLAVTGVRFLLHYLKLLLKSFSLQIFLENKTKNAIKIVFIYIIKGEIHNNFDIGSFKQCECLQCIRKFSH